MSDNLTISLSGSLAHAGILADVAAFLAERVRAAQLPMQQTQGQQTVAQQTPAQQTPAQQTPVQHTPAQAPVQQAPVQQTPVQHTPAQTPVQHTPAQQTPVQQAPVQQTPVQQTPVQQTPVQQTRAKELIGAGEQALGQAPAAFNAMLQVIQQRHGPQGAQDIMARYRAGEGIPAGAPIPPDKRNDFTCYLSTMVAFPQMPFHHWVENRTLYAQQAGISEANPWSLYYRDFQLYSLWRGTTRGIAGEVPWWGAEQTTAHNLGGVYV